MSLNYSLSEYYSSYYRATLRAFIAIVRLRAGGVAGTFPANGGKIIYGRRDFGRRTAAACQTTGDEHWRILPTLWNRPNNSLRGNQTKAAARPQNRQAHDHRRRLCRGVVA